MPHLLGRCLDQIQFAPASTFGNLTMIPLIWPADAEPAYVTLDEALPTGRFRVTEVSDSGHVPELRVTNDLDVPVLLLDGEELVGAKQNRVVNLTILVPAHAALTIPVSCVEAGRWHHVSTEFAGSERALFRQGRAHKMQQVTRALAAESVPRADQGDVWDRIHQRASALGARSETGAMHDIYEQHRHTVDEYVRAFPHVVGQTGAALAIDGRLAGVEFFDAARTMAALLPKIVSSYALDAVASRARDTHRTSLADEVKAWLGPLAGEEPRVHPAVGLGEALRWERPGMTAAALSAFDRIVHFAAFPLEDAPGAPPYQSRMRSASQRRRQRIQ